MFAELSPKTTVDISEHQAYSGILEYKGEPTTGMKQVSIVTNWFNADRLMFYFELLDVDGQGGNCTDSYLQIFEDSNKRQYVNGWY